MVSDCSRKAEKETNVSLDQWLSDCKGERDEPVQTPELYCALTSSRRKIDS